MHPNPGLDPEVKDFHNHNRNLNHNLDKLVKSYVMPLRDTVTENNLPIISKSYD